MTHGRRVAASLILLGAAGLAACSSTSPEAQTVAPPPAAGPAAPKALDDATAKVFEETESHADVAPHGGVVVPLGAHTAHAEVVIVPDTGEVSVYVLDGEGLAGQRVAQPTLVVDVETSGRLVRMEMKAQPDTDAGERVGDASRFAGRSDDLLRTGDAVVTLKWIGVNGQVFSDVLVDWPPDAL
jgi:hypothetical protein